MNGQLGAAGLLGALSVLGCNLALDIPERTSAPGYLCDAGTCTCEVARGDCDGDITNGCEVDLDNDAEHCGQCGQTCLGATCNEGRCEPHRLTALGDLGQESLDVVMQPLVARMAVFGGHVYWSSKGTAFGQVAGITGVTPPGIFRTPIDEVDVPVMAPVFAEASGGWFASSGDTLFASSGEPRDPMSAMTGTIVTFDAAGGGPQPFFTATDQAVLSLAFADGTLHAVTSSIAMTLSSQRLVLDDAGETQAAIPSASWRTTAIAGDGSVLYVARFFLEQGDARFEVARLADPRENVSTHAFTGPGLVVGVVADGDDVYFSCVECNRDPEEDGLVKRDAIMRWDPALNAPETLFSIKDITGFVVDEHHVYWTERVGDVRAWARATGEVRVLFASNAGGMAGLAQDAEALYFRDANAVYRLAKPIPRPPL